MLHDCIREGDQQGDMDYLRGASHALAALANPDLKMADAVEAVQFLRGRIAAGKQVPPLMWFLAKVSSGYYPRDAYDTYVREQEAVNAE